MNKCEPCEGDFGGGDLHVEEDDQIPEERALEGDARAGAASPSAVQL